MTFQANALPLLLLLTIPDHNSHQWSPTSDLYEFLQSDAQVPQLICGKQQVVDRSLSAPGRRQVEIPTTLYRTYAAQQRCAEHMRNYAGCQEANGSPELLPSAAGLATCQPAGSLSMTFGWLCTDPVEISVSPVVLQ